MSEVFDENAAEKSFFEKKPWLCMDGCVHSYVNGARWQFEQDKVRLKLAEMALHTNKVQAEHIGELKAALEARDGEIERLNTLIKQAELIITFEDKYDQCTRWDNAKKALGVQDER